VLGKLVLERIFAVSALAYEDTPKLLQLLMQHRKEASEKELRQKKRTFAQMEKRIEDLDKIFKRIYEDEITGAITRERFVKFSAEYEAEQADLRVQVEQLGKELSSFEQKQFNFRQFTAVIRKYVGIRELRPEIVNDFIKKIIVHAPDKSTGKRIQRVQIVFNFVGEVQLPDDQHKADVI
jgi:septal ring factor EnvC (AmiA/AmiB activator)